MSKDFKTFASFVATFASFVVLFYLMLQFEVQQTRTRTAREVGCEAHTVPPL